MRDQNFILSCMSTSKTTVSFHSYVHVTVLHASFQHSELLMTLILFALATLITSYLFFRKQLTTKRRSQHDYNKCGVVTHWVQCVNFTLQIQFLRLFTYRLLHHEQVFSSNFLSCCVTNYWRKPLNFLQQDYCLVTSLVLGCLFEAQNTNLCQMIHEEH